MDEKTPARIPPKCKTRAKQGLKIFTHLQTDINDQMYCILFSHGRTKTQIYNLKHLVKF